MLGLPQEGKAPLGLMVDDEPLIMLIAVGQVLQTALFQAHPANTVKAREKNLIALRTSLEQLASNLTSKPGQSLTGYAVTP